ncbi:MAG: PKD domain-containing protein [Candidatus Omnitrophica bacterium]|nr:PKD domain-containing protein [Candidatus Omnitrophota bacterium]
MKINNHLSFLTAFALFMLVCSPIFANNVIPTQAEITIITQNEASKAPQELSVGLLGPNKARLPTSSDDLIAVASGSYLEEGKAVIYKYTWYKDGILQADLTTNKVPNERLKKGQIWKCVVTPTDGKTDGPESETEVKIQNSPPEFIENQKSLRLVAITGKPLYVSLKANDKDEDPVSYMNTPAPRGAVIDSASRLLNFIPTQDQAGKKIRLSVTAYDNESSASQNIEIEVVKASKAVDLTAFLPPVGNQGYIGSCTSWATGYYNKTFQEAKERGWSPADITHQCSPSFIYNQTFVYQTTDDEDDGGGSYPLEALDLLTVQGCAPISEMPYTYDYRLQPTADQYESGMPFRSQDSFNYSFQPSIQTLKNLLDAGNIVILSLPVFSDWLGYTGGNGVHDGPRSPPYVYVGGHAMAVVGYDDSKTYTNLSNQTASGAFRVVNSWGSSWRDSGFIWMSYNFVQSKYTDSRGYVYATWAYSMTDKINYVTNAIAQFNITHPDHSDLAVYVANQDDTCGPNMFYPRRYSTRYSDAPNISAAADITDCMTELPPSQNSPWYLWAADAYSGYAGTIDSFIIKYRPSPSSAYTQYTATDVPVSIPDNQQYVSSVITGKGTNNPPTQPTVTIAPTQPKTSDNLTATASGSTDPDGDTVTYRYAWFKNNVLQASLTTNTVASSNTAKGQTWKCVVTPSDGKDDGPSAEASVTIENTAPELAAIGNKNIAEGATLGFTISATDADNDTLTYSATGLPTGSTFTAATRTFTWTPNYSQSGTYQVTFNVTDGTTPDSETITITVNNTNQPPTAVISATPQSGRVPLVVQFSSDDSSDPDGTIASYSWNFGDGVTDTQANPSHTYVIVDTFTATLTVTDNEGADSDTEQITITAREANHEPILTSIGNKTISEAQSLQFTVQAEDPDGDTLTYSASGLPRGASFNAGTHQFSWTPDFTQSGNYQTAFSVSDGQLSTQETITITVTNINQNPVARITATPTTGLIPLTVQFGSAGSNDPDGGALTYAWSFGDGGTAVTANPSHEYPTAGSYTVGLTVTDTEGATGSAQITITASEPNYPPVLNTIGDKTVAENQLLQFTVSASDRNNDPLTYSASGLPSGASFNTNTLQFSWTPNYAQAGKYNPTFAVSDGELSDSETITITVTNVNQPPIAVITAAPRTGKAPLSVRFSSTGTSDPDGTIESFNWQFGDGATSTEQNPEHIYSSEGTYTASLTITDNDGANDSETVSITVRHPNRKPIFNAITNKTTAEGQAMSFSVSAADEDADPLAYSAQSLPSGASFNTSTRTFSWTPSYTQAGQYTVNFNVTDGEESDTAPASITVTNVNRPPVAVISATPTMGRIPLSVQFSSEGTNDPDNNITSYSWNFGDETISNEQNPNHTYTNPGAYTVNFMVTDSELASASKSLTITVKKENTPPVAVIVVSTQEGATPLTVQFNSNGSSDEDGNIVAYNWDFGDGSGSTEANPTHIYRNYPWWEEKYYTAALTITDNEGASANSQITIKVKVPSGQIRAR